MIREFEAPIGGSVNVNGWIIRSQRIFTFRTKEPGETSFHEITHGFMDYLDGGDPEMSIKPGPGYLGITRLNRFNPRAFAAAYAFGCDGTGYDVSVLTNNNYDVSALASGVKRRLWPYYDEMMVAASRIEAEETISGYQLWEVIDQVQNPLIETDATGPNGEKHQFVTKIRKGTRPLLPIDISTRVTLS